MNSLDIETAGKADGYALEPWRYPDDGWIESVAVCYDDGTVKQIEDMAELPSLLATLDGKDTWAHNGPFDVAWMLNYVPKSVINKIKWKDTLLAAKWLLNGQKLEKKQKYGKFGLDLDNLISTFLKTHPQYERFHEIKSMDVAPGDDPEYWLERGNLDAILTRDLGAFFYGKMDEGLKRGFDIECRCIVPIAESWVRGIRLNMPKIAELQTKVAVAQKNISAKLGIAPSVITSPKQLTAYLFTEKGYRPKVFTPKGAPSAGKEALMELYYENNQDPTLRAIMDFKNITTMKSKFLDGAEKCTKHNKHDYSHATPRLFGTVTGRMTYSNKTLRKYFIGLAQHQIPRQGPIKGVMSGDEDEYVVHFDAAAQELRFIGQIAHEKSIIRAFNEGMDLHSDMASDIAGWSYEKMMAEFHNKESELYTEAYNFRQAGKLTNLSCQYRIGAPSLAKKFFTTYQIFIDQRTSYHYLNTYKRRYPGVVAYWDAAIKLAKEKGYAESIGGRRFRIHEFGWQGESNAINHPIQGSGADHMEVAISIMNESVPEARLLTVMHDGIYWAIKNKDTAQDMHAVLNGIDFQEVWNKEIFLPLPFDGEIGTNFKDIKEFTYHA